MNLTLKAVAGYMTGETFTFTPGEHATMGRSRGNNLRLYGDVAVSRVHCLIEMFDGKWTVQDLGSLNGTHVNGELIARNEPSEAAATMVLPSKTILEDGDELRICTHVFSVIIEEGTNEQSIVS